MYFLTILKLYIKVNLKHLNYFRKDNTFNDIMKTDSLDKETFVPPIYNFVSSSVNPLTWGEFSMLNKKYGCEVPSVKAVCT